ncbi:MAG: tRNA (guanine(10)-N(2))-dimethyltransferase [Candidatus Micrarchaeia archaeon]
MVTGEKNKKAGKKPQKKQAAPASAKRALLPAAAKPDALKSAQLATEGSPQSKFAMPTGVFYNPEMELCRDMFSLFTGTLPEKIGVADLMCASGIRGLRYKIENRNVSSLSMSDLSEKAIACAKKNAKMNRVKCNVEYIDACEFPRKHKGEYDLLELDPFGTPVPFLHDAIKSFEDRKEGFLSITATDMAVLCGANHAACLKNYGAAPLDNEFCHENAVRILLGKIVLASAQFNLGIDPLFSFSHRHYVKVALRLEKGAEKAVACVKKMGYVSYCPGCCWRESSRLPRHQACPLCAHQLAIGGPMYLGHLWDGKTLEGMQKQNAKRDYQKKAQLEKMLLTIQAESRVGTLGYYDLHVLAKKKGTRIAGMDDALAAMRNAGFLAERTHFSPTSIRTNAPHDEVVRRLAK